KGRSFWVPTPVLSTIPTSARPCMLATDRSNHPRHAGAHMRSGNPALKDSTFLDLNSGTVVQGGGTTMTLNGTVNKTAFLLVMTLAGALYTWNLFFASNGTANLMPYVWGGAIGGLVVALVTIFKKTWSPFTAPLYAGLEGLFIGAV